jgi:hypothetical protein
MKNTHFALFVSLTVFLTNLSLGIVGLVFSVHSKMNCSNGFLHLDKWLMGASIFNIIAACTLVTVLYKAIVKEETLYGMLTSIQLGVYNTFILIWLIMGFVIQFNNSKACFGTPVWIISLVTLIFYCIEFVSYGVLSCVISFSSFLFLTEDMVVAAATVTIMDKFMNGDSE